MIRSFDTIRSCWRPVALATAVLVGVPCFAFEVEGVAIPAKQGDFVVVPRGAQHTYTNPGDTPAEVLVLISPPGFEQHFIEMGEAVEGA